MRMKIFAGPLLASLLCAQSLPEMRMLPAEMHGAAVDGNQIGSSGLAGVHTKVLFGDPFNAGFSSILLFVPDLLTEVRSAYPEVERAGGWWVDAETLGSRSLQQDAEAGQAPAAGRADAADR